MQRIQTLVGHLGPTAGISTHATAAAAGHAAPGTGGGAVPRQMVERSDDVVVVSALRTPIGKAKRGSFKDTRAEDLLSAAFKGVLDETKIPPHLIGDIVVGNVLAPGGGAFLARIAQFFSGIPETVPVNTVNRQCSSGLQAFANLAGGIRNGAFDIGIASGVESMSLSDRGAARADYHPKIFDQQLTKDCLVPMGVESMSLNRQGSEGDDLNPKVFENELARDCLVPMGITSENVAEKFGITREQQDLMGFQSQQKASRAKKLGLFKDEIIPVTTTIKDKEGNEREITVSEDDGIRPGTTLEGLAKLRTAFKKDGTTTAGNSSQVSDGAAAVLAMKRNVAKQMGLPVLGVFVSFAVVGVPPAVMGIGPAYAIPEALKRAGLTVDDIDIFEINEAFASQATYSVEKLGIPMEKVNPLGGAIALGHPLGCTGSRQIATLLHELKRRGKPAYGVISMCIGTGMGAAAVFYHPGK